jgi:hypothetical protein
MACMKSTQETTACMTARKSLLVFISSVSHAHLLEHIATSHGWASSSTLQVTACLLLPQLHSWTPDECCNTMALAQSN